MPTTPLSNIGTTVESSQNVSIDNRITTSGRPSTLDVSIAIEIGNDKLFKDISEFKKDYDVQKVTLKSKFGTVNECLYKPKNEVRTVKILNKG